MTMKKLCAIWISAAVCAACLAVAVQAHGEGASLGISVELLRKLFPEAEGFVAGHKDLTEEVISNIEQALGDKLHDSDKDLRVWVALAKNPKTGKIGSIGAALVVDAEGAEGIIDVLVGYKLDGAVRKVLIMNNREDKNLEADSFLGQLEGRRPTDGWDLKKDFRLVVASPTSAARVVQAVHRGMHLVVAFMKSWDPSEAGL